MHKDDEEPTIQLLCTPSLNTYLYACMCLSRLWVVSDTPEVREEPWLHRIQEILPPSLLEFKQLSFLSHMRDY